MRKEKAIQIAIIFIFYTFFLELTRRGYNLSSVLRENTGKTAEIIKIG